MKPTREQKKVALTKIVQYLMKQKEEENLEENKKEDPANKNE